VRVRGLGLGLGLRSGLEKGVRVRVKDMGKILMKVEESVLYGCYFFSSLQTASVWTGSYNGQNHSVVVMTSIKIKAKDKKKRQPKKTKDKKDNGNRQEKTTEKRQKKTTEKTKKTKKTKDTKARIMSLETLNTTLDGRHDETLYPQTLNPTP
jgi:hypothetical protein